MTGPVVDEPGVGPALSALLTERHRSVPLVFGAGTAPVPAGAALDSGLACFSGTAGTDRVGLLMTNDRPTVELILGAVVAGSRLVSLPLPGRGTDVGAYGSFLRDVCRAHEITEVVVADGHAPLVEGIGLTARRHSELDRGGPVAAPTGRGFELVQFTSGSTGLPRAVAVDDEGLGANVSAILAVVQPQPGDTVVSWLPLAHDMGLVGMLLAGLVGLGAANSSRAGGGSHVLLDPSTFLRDPRSWIEALHHYQGTFSAAPDFGFRLATRYPARGGIDLSRVRCAIVGGEVVRASTLAAFGSSYADRGLDSLALCPAYGMAELGLAATLTAPDRPWRSRRLSAAALADGHLAVPTGDDVVELVASGQPLPGYQVVGPSTDGAVGPIAVTGPSIGRNPTTGRSLADGDGWLRPGDVGFVDDDGLFVCGRSDDYVVANGRNIYAPAVEDAAGAVAGLRPGRVTAVGLPSGEWVVVAETVGEPPGAAQAETIGRAVRRGAVSVCAARPDAVVLVGSGQLPLTSSGKLQRNLVRSRLGRGELSVLHTI